MSDRFLPYGRQWVDAEDIEAVTRVLESDKLTTGPAVDEFERALETATGAAHAIAVNSGTAALHAGYFGAGIGKGDEIVTSPLSFAATANAALYLGATVRFVDVEPDTGNLDPAAIEPALSDRTRAVVAVDYAGHPADYDAISEVTRRHGLKLLADSAHSIGGRYQGRSVGTLADASIASFHPVKAITTCEGGAVLTADTELAQRARRFRSHGIDATPDSPEGPWYQEMIDLGFNYRLSDVHSALGLSQVRRLGEFVERRREITRRYTEALTDDDRLILPRQRDGVEAAWHLYVVQVAGDAARRRPFFDALRRRNLGVQVHYIPIYHHPFYRDLGYPRGLCPVAEERYERSVSLPLYPAMTDADVDLAIERTRAAADETL